MKLYLIIVGLFLMPAVLAGLLGVHQAAALTISLILVFACSLVGLGFLVGLYLATPAPRSEFFRMLLNSAVIKELAQAWIVYVLIAVAFQTIELPVPDADMRQLIISVIAVAVLASTVFFAVKSWLIVRAIAAKADAKAAEAASE